MELQFYLPTTDILKKYIEGYYFVLDRHVGGTEKYRTFPNNYSIVTTNLNSDVTLGESSISIVPSPRKNIYASFVYRYIHPIEVYYEKPINEITIYFKPLGINHFVNNLETMFAEKNMTEFIPSLPDFNDEMTRIFQLTNRELQIEALEKYWMSKLAVKDLAFMQSILTDIESNLKIEEIAGKHNISRKHLNNLVLKHLGKSPTEYRKIYRFRNAIRDQKKSGNLTELSYENLFYDQSHLIKDFKTLTKINPKTFFKNVDTGSKNVWLFI